MMATLPEIKLDVIVIGSGMGGMTTATLLTLLVVPVFYTVFDDARGAFGAVMRRVQGGGRSAEESAKAA